MGESKIKYYFMDFDTNNNALRFIFDKLDSLIDKGYDLSYVFKDKIFRGCNQFVRDYRGVPCWLEMQEILLNVDGQRRSLKHT